MNRQSVNPVTMLGSYLGLAAGLLFFLKGWHPFWWLPPLIGFEIPSQIFLDGFGGFLAGYILHILYRIFRWDGDGGAPKMKKMR